jgi:hypothetical protein
MRFLLAGIFLFASWPFLLAQNPSVGTDRVIPKQDRKQQMFNGSIYCVANLNACVADEIALGGGRVVIPPGVSISLTSTLTLGNSNGVPLTLVIERGGQVVINVPGGVPAIQISKGGSLSCPESGYHQLAESGRVPSILMGPSANITDLIVNAIQDGTQGTADIDGCFMFNPGGSTGIHSGAAVHWVSLSQNTHARDTIIEGFHNVDILIENTAGIFSSSYFLDNVIANTSGLAGGVPLRIQSHPTGSPASIRVNGGQYVHPGAGLPNIDCEGAGSIGVNAPYLLTIEGAYVEASFPNNIGLKIRDCHDVNVTGLVGAGAGGDLVNVGQSGAGLTYNIQMNGVYNANWTNWFNDTVNTVVYAGAASIPCANFTVTLTTCTQTVGTGTSTSYGTIIHAGTSQAQPAINVTGATTTDVAVCALNARPPTTWQTGIQLLPPVVTANTVTPWLSNPTEGNIAPAAAVIRCTVIR